MITALTNFLSNPISHSNINNEISLSTANQMKTSIANEKLENSLQKVVEEMNRRATNLGYGLGVALGKQIGTRDDSNQIEQSQSVLNHKIVKHIKVEQRQESKEVLQSESSDYSLNEAVPFSTYYQQLFPQDTIKVIYLELDPGVDDGAALLQLLAAKNTNSKEGKKVEVVGIVPCVGNAVLAQTEQNTLRFLELTDNQDIKVYPGAIAPLAIENNQTAINEMNQGIKATHFYGHDGEADVEGWPTVNMNMQTTAGYQFAAARISEVTPDAPLTLVSTSALTELSKTLTELERLNSENGLSPGSFAKNINAISIMGGCLNPAVGCNAPFDVPDNQKTSEANFYFDSLAAQHVFATCQKYQIPILISPLDLTQQKGLLWTKEQVNALDQINNPVAHQMARVTDIVPYLDEPCFPNNTYPMHDLQAVTNFLFPDFYNVTRIAASIGNVGQIIVNPNAPEEQKNVYVLGMPIEKQSLFYQTVLPEYHEFDCVTGNINKPDRCQPTSNQFTIGKIVAFISLGLASLGLGALSAIGIYKWRKRNIEAVDEEKALLSQHRTAVKQV